MRAAANGVKCILAAIDSTHRVGFKGREAALALILL